MCVHIVRTCRRIYPGRQTGTHCKRMCRACIQFLFFVMSLATLFSRGAHQLLVGLDQLAVAHVQVDRVDVLYICKVDRAGQRNYNIAHLTTFLRVLAQWRSSAYFLHSVKSESKKKSPNWVRATMDVQEDESEHDVDEDLDLCTKTVKDFVQHPCFDGFMLFVISFNGMCMVYNH